MRTPFLILFGVTMVYALSKDVPNVDSVLALYRAPQDRQVSGATIFRKCAICHSLAPGEHRIGPSLHCIVGRKIASQPGFRYSTAMRSARLDSEFGPYEPEVWTRETLTAYVMDPALTFGNTRMPFPGLLATVPDEDLYEVTKALVDYLEESCDAAPRNLVALESAGAGAAPLRCMTIAHEKSLSDCEALADSLRAGEDSEHPTLPALACVVPGRLACDADPAASQ